MHIFLVYYRIVERSVLMSYTHIQGLEYVDIQQWNRGLVLSIGLSNAVIKSHG